jgi:hypothetical protein
MIMYMRLAGIHRRSRRMVLEQIGDAIRISRRICNTCLSRWIGDFSPDLQLGRLVILLRLDGVRRRCRRKVLMQMVIMYVHLAGAHRRGRREVVEGKLGLGQ